MWNNKLCLCVHGGETPVEEQIALFKKVSFDGFFVLWQEGMSLRKIRDFSDSLGMYFQSVHAPFTHILPFDGVVDWADFARRIKACGYNRELTFELNLFSKPGRHENDAYAEMPFETYLTETFERACRVAKLVSNAVK